MSLFKGKLNVVNIKIVNYTYLDSRYKFFLKTLGITVTMNLSRLVSDRF